MGHWSIMPTNIAKLWDRERKNMSSSKLLDTQKRVIERFTSYNQNLVLKYRQGGISTVTELYYPILSYQHQTKDRYGVKHPKQLAKKFLKETTDFIDNLPEFFNIK